MSNEREELADVLQQFALTHDRDDSATWGDYADAILAAGYIKPRTITTVEDLDAMPEGTQIVDLSERLTLEETSLTYLEWVDRHGNACHVQLPATVLYSPEVAE